LESYEYTYEYFNSYNSLMKKGYTHIREGERRQIYTLLCEGREQDYIATRLKRDPWTISREISRHSVDGLYMPVYAQRVYENMRSEINKWRSKLKNNPKMVKEIKRCLIKKKWSPDALAGRKKKKWKSFVSTMTIYNYIRDWEPSLKKYLKNKKWYKKRYSKQIKKILLEMNVRRIDERPAIVDERTRIGDREGDTIHSSWSERKWWMVTLVDRQSKYLEGKKLIKRSSEETIKTMISLLGKHELKKNLTITLDNGKEFSWFEDKESLVGITTYRAHKYASYERWTNEETNGMLRVFFPKWTDFSKISDEEIAEAIRFINLRPRKSLEYKCAYEVFHGVNLRL